MDSTTVLTSIGSSTVISGVIGLIGKYYFDARLEREKAQRSAAASKLEAEQTRITNRLQTTFTTLQTERATTIKELYAKIVQVEVVLNTLAVEKTLTDKSARQYHAAVVAFVDYYLPNRIWLPSAVSDQVGELRSTFWSLGKALRRCPHDVPLSAEFRQGLHAIKFATARALEEVSATFRELLGAEDRPKQETIVRERAV